MRRIDGNRTISSAIANTHTETPNPRHFAFNSLSTAAAATQFPTWATYSQIQHPQLQFAPHPLAICTQISCRGDRAMATLLLDARLTATRQLAPDAVSPPSSRGSVVVAMGLRALPASRGLRIGSSRTKASSPASLRSKRRGIVCEAQETVTGVPGVVNESTWKSLVGDSDLPVLVDFWAPWCGPCRMIAPIIDEIAKKYAGKVRCLKLNTDESPNIATEYGIRSIPTVMVFLKGEKRDTVIGAVPMQTLTSTLEKYIAW